jgi:hypothetical protein
MSLAGRGIVDDQTQLLRARGGLFGNRCFRSGATYQARSAVGGERSSPVGPTSDGIAPTSVVQTSGTLSPERSFAGAIAMTAVGSFPPYPAKGQSEKASVRRGPRSWQVDGRRCARPETLVQCPKLRTTLRLILISVAKDGFLGDPLDRQPSLLEQIPGGLRRPQAEDSQRRGQATDRFLTETPR